MLSRRPTIAGVAPEMSITYVVTGIAGVASDEQAGRAVRLTGLEQRCVALIESSLPVGFGRRVLCAGLLEGVLGGGDLLLILRLAAEHLAEAGVRGGGRDPTSQLCGVEPVWPTLEAIVTEAAPTLVKRVDPRSGLALIAP